MRPPPYAAMSDLVPQMWPANLLPAPLLREGTSSSLPVPECLLEFMNRALIGQMKLAVFFSSS